jgi:hypothetical protein
MTDAIIDQLARANPVPLESLGEFKSDQVHRPLSLLQHYPCTTPLSDVQSPQQPNRRYSNRAVTPKVRVLRFRFAVTDPSWSPHIRAGGWSSGVLVKFRSWTGDPRRLRIGSPHE